MQLHIAANELASHPIHLTSLAEHPIAFLGGAIFGIFGEERRLFRINASSGAVEEALEEDTHFFSLTLDGDDWDRNSVRIDNSGIVFSHAGIRDAFAPQERAVRGSPLIVPGCIVAVGMEDGRVLIYDSGHLPHHEIWRLGGDSDSSISALATFDSFLAAGNKDGLVEVRALLTKGSPAR